MENSFAQKISTIIYLEVLLCLILFMLEVKKRLI